MTSLFLSSFLCPSHLIYIRSVLFELYKNRDSYRFHNLANLTDIIERLLSEKNICLLKTVVKTNGNAFCKKIWWRGFVFHTLRTFLIDIKLYRIMFLAHLSRRLKWAFLIKICPLSVVVVVVVTVVIVVVNFSHFHLLPQNQWTNFNQTWHKASLGEGDSSLFKWRAQPFSKGR